MYKKGHMLQIYPRWWPFDLRVARALWNLGGGF